MKQNLKTAMDCLWYVFVFIFIQLVTDMVALGAASVIDDKSFSFVVKASQNGAYGEALVISHTISSVLTIALFCWRRWIPASRAYLRSKPWAALIWIIPFALGLIPILQYAYELLGVEEDADVAKMFSGMMKSQWAYLALAIIVPVTEEIVFRGALLGTLLKSYGERYAWLWIALSAAAFGLVHGNLAQGVNAFVIGIIIGWFYLRSGSIVPASSCTG